MRALTIQLRFYAMTLMLLVLGCTSNQTVKVETNNDEQSVNAEMKELFLNFSEFLVLISNRADFHAPQNRPKVLKSTEKLLDVSHRVKEKMESKNLDPTYEFIAREFETDLNDISTALSSGRVEYARQNLQALTSRCLSCHLQGDNGPEYVFTSEPSGLRKLSSFQKGEFFVATRQFERALGEFEKVMHSSRTHPYSHLEWERAARYSLAISVREEPSEEKASRVIDIALAEKKIPHYMKEDAAEWKRSLSLWAKEKTPRPAGAVAKLKKARLLLKTARQQQQYPGDRKADLTLLRAQRLLRDTLSQNAIRKPEQAEALYLLGTINESLQNVDFWNMYELYYERCIRVLPRTELAQKCFSRLEQSIILGYTGSAGYSLPNEERVRLNKLRALIH